MLFDPKGGEKMIKPMLRWTGFLLFALVVRPVAAAPVVSSFAPTAGAPGTQVTLRGSGFNSATTVQFDLTLADFWVLNDTALVAVVPLDAVTGRLWVSALSGAGSSLSDFTVPPRISSFFPSRGGPGTAITIMGFNFNGTTNVQVNGSNASFTVTAPDQIRAFLPAGATKGPICVRTPIGAACSTEAFTVTGPAPMVDGFSPAYGAPGAEILIEGVNFTNVTAVRFNNRPATAFAAPADTQIRAVVPAGATTGRISVTTASGNATNTNNFIVTFLPVILDFYPSLGKAGQPTPITLEGINFSNVTGVSFNGRPATAFSSPASGQISVAIPNDATTGLITVTNSFGAGSSIRNFVVTTAPIVEGFDPWLGSAGLTVQLNGENFTGVSAVRFGSTASPRFSTPASTILYAEVPTGATSSPIVVVNGSGSFVTGSNFVITPSFPFLTRVLPTNGPRGTVLEIYGVNFGATPTVRFNGIPDPSPPQIVQEGSEFRITTTVPAAATTGPLTVSSSAGTSTNAIVFYAAPRLAGFSPTNGVAGEAITLTGTNFTGATAVLFNQQPAAFTATNAGRLTARVPTNATTGPITLVTPGGLITSTNAFRVRPTIFSYSPALGPTGTVVTISGAAFAGVTGVSFGGAAAAFGSVTLTQLLATVPTNAVTGPVQVQTTNDEAISATPFVVTGPGDGSLSILTFPNSLQPGDTNAFTLVASNGGPSAISQVSVVCMLPTNFVLLTVSNTLGACTPAAGTVTCDLGLLTNGAAAVITLAGRFAPEGLARLDARLSAAEFDPAPLNNHPTPTSVVASNSSRTLSVVGTLDGPRVIISWPVSSVGFQLQESGQVGSSAFWQASPTPPAVSSGQNRVTNSASPPRRFYRLQAPQF